MIERVEYVIYPFIILAAGINKKVTVRYLYDILDSRIVRVDLCAGREQHADIRIRSRRKLPDKIIRRKYSSNDINASGGIRRAVPGAHTG